MIASALSGGGAEAVARLMVQEIDGVRCVLFENKAGVKIPGRRVDKIQRLGGDSLFGKALSNVWRVVYVQYVKIMMQPRITISHLEGPNFTNILTFFGGRRILFVHNRVSSNYQQDSFVDSLKVKLIKWLYHRANLVLGVSPDICTELVEVFGVSSERINVLPNPIDIAEIRENSNKSYGDSRDNLCDQRYLISLASLTHQKNHKLLIRSFKKLVDASQNYSDLKLVLVGEGEKRIELEDLCTELELSKTRYDRSGFDLSARVVFMGFQSNPFPLLRKAQLLVMPSLWEGLPISLLETLALGVPPVVSNCSSGVRAVFDYPAEDTISSDSGESVRTPVGVLVTGSVAEDDSTAVDLWAAVIGETLTDTDYLESCISGSTDRALEYDLSRIRGIWEKSLYR